VKYEITLVSENGARVLFQPKPTFEEAFESLSAYLEDWRRMMKVDKLPSPPYTVSVVAKEA
jgi:hypothetical protein